jgi:hypothetical protein
VLTLTPQPAGVADSGATKDLGSETGPSVVVTPLDRSRFGFVRNTDSRSKSVRVGTRWVTLAPGDRVAL